MQAEHLGAEPALAIQGQVDHVLGGAHRVADQDDLAFETDPLRAFAQEIADAMAFEGGIAAGESQ